MPRPRLDDKLAKRLTPDVAARILRRPLDGAEVEPPAWMTARAKKVWEEVAPTLEAASLTQGIDAQILGMYCEAHATWQRESRRRKDRDEEMISKWFKLAGQFADKLGMNPKARVAIRVTPKEKTSLVDEFRIA